MPSLRHPLFIISDIISFNEDRSQLVNDLQHPNINWEKIVKIGSQHLVLSTIYCRLNQKKLIQYLPEDLITYLNEITEINRNRNLTLLNEVKEITRLFKNHSINYVFIKGTAMVLGEYYEDIAERMIGDIDILVSNPDVLRAQNVLIDNGYESTSQTLNSTYFNIKHLPRLTSNTKISAVEIHRHLFNNAKKKYISPEELLLNKTETKDTFIPRGDYHLIHNIYNYQINDHGQYYKNPNLRSYYDSLILMKSGFSSERTNDDIIGDYKTIASVFLKDFKNDHNRQSIGLRIRLKYSWIQNSWMQFLIAKAYCFTLLKRLQYFIINKKYRNDLLKRCFRTNNS